MDSLFLITCLNCHASREVKIIQSATGDIIDWLDNNPDQYEVKIVSGRKRLDGVFGWQCICGNDDLMTDQENKYIKNKQSPSYQDVNKITQDLHYQKPKFSMELA